MPIAPIVIAAAALHATWNALVKPARDRLALMTVMGVASVAVSLPIALLARQPHTRALPELVGSSFLHIVYDLLLIASYREGDFNQVYPIARGTSPPTVALCAVLFVGEGLSAVQTAGILLVSAGLFTLAAGRTHRAGRALGLAVLTGLSISAYTVVDGVGVRRSGSALGYAVWLFVGQGVLIALTFWVLRRSRLPARRTLWLRGSVAGILSLVAYGLVLWAQTRGALAVVAALRETSVVFAAAIGALAFREHLPVRRVFASVVVAVGAAVLALG